MTTRKTRTRKHVIADVSLHYLAYIVVSCSHTVEPTRTDYGYDLSIFAFDTAGQYENGNIFVQLEATDSLRVDRRTGEIKFRISKCDVLTWESEPFPAYLVVFDAAHGKAYAVYLQRYFADSGISSITMKRASIAVRLSDRNVETATIESWRVDKNAVLTQMGAITRVEGDNFPATRENVTRIRFRANGATWEPRDFSTLQHRGRYYRTAYRFDGAEYRSDGSDHLRQYRSTPNCECGYHDCICV